MGGIGMPGLATMGGQMSPEQQAQLLSQIQRAQAGAGGQGSQPMQQALPPQMQQQGGGQQMPQMQTPGQQPQMPRLGGGNIMLPSGTASPAVPGVPMSATPPRGMTPQGGNPGTSVRANGIAAIPGAVIAIKNQQTQSKVQKFRSMTNEWLALQSDPNMKQQRDALAKSDPKLAKVFEKKQQDFVKMYDEAIKDPQSPAAQGIQLAYQDQQRQEQTKISYQQMQAKMEQERAMAQHQQALAAQAQATANLRQTQSEDYGKLSEAEKAKLDARYAGVTAQINGRLQQTQMQTKAMLEAIASRVEASKYAADARARGQVGAARVRAGASKAGDYIIKEYKAIHDQAAELDKQAKDLQSHLDKNAHWYGDADDKDEVQSKLQQIEVQRSVLAQQYQMLQAKDQAFQRSGMVMTPPPGPGEGTQDSPIVIP